MQGVLTVVVLAVLSRLLAPEDFGVVSASLLVVNFSLIFSQIGVGPAIVQHPDLTPEHIGTGFVLSMLLSLACASLIWLFAPVIASAVASPAVIPVLRVLVWVLPIQGLSVVSDSLLRRELRFRAIASARVISYVAGYGIVGVATALAGFGPWALVAAHATQTITNMALLVRARPLGVRPRFHRGAWHDLVRFGSGFALARVGNYAAVYGDNMVTATTLGVRALGLYERAYQLMAMPATAIGQVIDDVLFPAMAQVQRERERLARAYQRCLAGVALLTLPVSALAIILAPEIVAVLFGSQWSSVVAPLRVLAVGMLFRTSYKISDSLTRAVGAVYRRAWRQWIYAGLVTGGAWLGHERGLTGIAVGVLVALLVNFALMAELSLEIVGMSRRAFVAAHLPAVFCATGAALPAWAAASLARHGGLPPLAVLVASLAVAAASLAILYRLHPTLILGQDGQWLVDRVRAMSESRLKRVSMRFARQAS